MAPQQGQTEQVGCCILAHNTRKGRRELQGAHNGTLCLGGISGVGCSSVPYSVDCSVEVVVYRAFDYITAVQYRVFR